MKRLPPLVIRAAKLAGLGAAVISIGACGDLDNVTTVKDLRVLAVKAEPAGFLVPLDHPEMFPPETKATVTALVVDPNGQGATLSFSGAACPDYIDTITAASGKGSSLCPGPEVTGKLPPPLDTALATTTLTPDTATPTAMSTIEYEPAVKFGLSSEQLGLFFSPAPNLQPAVAQTIQYNRDFGMDAIVNVDFALGDETASMIKRVVYWPLLPDDLLPVGDEAQKPDCPATQVANQNPVITKIDFFSRRVEGEPMDLYPDAMPTLSLAAKNELFVQPTYDPASVEKYLLRVQDFNAGTVVTRCRHELLTFQFFATAGTFEPAQRASELPIVLTSEDGKVHLDSKWAPPKVEDLPADNKVTIWVVVRDERAGAFWMSRTFFATP